MQAWVFHRLLVKSIGHILRARRVVYDGTARLHKFRKSITFRNIHAVITVFMTVLSPKCGRGTFEINQFQVLPRSKGQLSATYNSNFSRVIYIGTKDERKFKKPFVSRGRNSHEPTVLCKARRDQVERTFISSKYWLLV